MPPTLRRLLHLFCVLGAACTPSSSTVEPVYEGCATDENWISFDDYERTARVTTTGNNLPQWNAPQTGAALPVTTPGVFRWQPTATAAGSVDGDATCPQHQTASFAGALQPKHLPPVSGTAYDVHFAVAGSDVYRVITTLQRTGISSSILAGWAGKTVTVTLISAKLLVNSIAEGPYQAAPLQLQVTP